MIVEGLIAHAVGDYLIQSHWMATQKTKRWLPAVAHALTYMLPFLLITRSGWALLAICATHAVIDRYRLARHVCWLKNQVGPASSRASWRSSAATGYPPGTPVWLSTWLLIIADNTIHVLINSAALTWLG
jgi:hypothetical protein